MRCVFRVFCCSTIATLCWLSHWRFVATPVAAADSIEELPAVLFSDSFDDALLLKRGRFDGTLVIERANIVLRSTDFPNMKFNQFLLTPYFGPGLLPHAQTLWIDELAVGTQRLEPGMRK